MSLRQIFALKALTKWLLPIIVIVAAGFGFKYLVASKQVPPAKKAEEKVWSVATQTLTPNPHPAEAEIYGRVEASEESTLSASVATFVKEVRVSEGDSVKKGDLLIQLDPRDAQLVLDQRQAEVKSVRAQIEAENLRHKIDKTALAYENDLLELTKRSLERYESLQKRKLSSEDQVDSARRAYQQQQLSLLTRQQSLSDHPNRMNQLEAALAKAVAAAKAAELDLTRTQLVAPYDARITQVAISTGDRVRIGDSLVTLFDPSTLEIRAQLPTRLQPVIQQLLDQKSPVVANIDGREALKLARISASIESGKAGVDIFFKVTDRSRPLELGRVLSLAVQLPVPANSFALPPQAIYGTNRVYQVKDDRLVAVAVAQAGNSRDEQGRSLVLVQSDQLQTGDRVLTTQLPNAISGLRVKPLNSPEANAK